MYIPDDDLLSIEDYMEILEIIRQKNPQTSTGSEIVSIWEDYGEVVLMWMDAIDVKIVGLWPSQQIVAHTDFFHANQRRYHVPLQTNANCWTFHDGTWQQPKTYTTYRMDPNKPHGAVNWGESIRWHLMVDVRI